MGDNVNGPSLIRAPDWLDNPLGRYYLYFAHHDGHYIRLACADDLDGPWTVHPPGVLPLADSRFKGHIASPDVHVDDDERRAGATIGSNQVSGSTLPMRSRLSRKVWNLIARCSSSEICCMTQPPQRP